MLLSAHPVSGASTWAGLLGVPEMPLVVAAASAGPVLVAARSTVDGIRAAKRMNGALPGHVLRVVLLVADAPGSVPRLVRDELAGLAGVCPVVAVPWVPALRGVPAGAVALARVRRPVEKVSVAVAAAVEKAGAAVAASGVPGTGQ